MSNANPPPSAATTRVEAAQSLKRSVQAAFDGVYIHPLIEMLCILNLFDLFVGVHSVSTKFQVEESQ